MLSREEVERLKKEFQNEEKRKKEAQESLEDLFLNCPGFDDTEHFKAIKELEERIFLKKETGQSEINWSGVFELIRDVTKEVFTSKK